MPTLRHFILPLCLLLSLPLACDAPKGADGTPHLLSSQERAGLDHYGKRRTLDRMGDLISEIFSTGQLIASRDQVFFVGPEKGERLLVVKRPRSSGNNAMIIQGPKILRDVPLAEPERVLFSPRGQAMVVYRGYDPVQGEPWLPGTDVKIYGPDSKEPATIPRKEGLALEALFDDGRLLIRDPQGHMRLYDQAGTLLKEYDLDGFFESPDGTGSKSRVDVLQAQGLIALRDFNGPQDPRGKAIQSGLRLFSVKDGALISTYPKGMKAYAPSANADRFLMLERGGKLTRFDKGVEGPSVHMPGSGEIALSPSGDYATVTSSSNRLWLLDVNTMRVLWEHTSPEPWNRFMEKGTFVADGGRVFASRLHLTEVMAPVALQIFTIDAAGSGLVLIERPYKDVLIAPVAMMGISDEGETALFGAIGEEVRVFKVGTATNKATPAKLPAQKDEESPK